MPGEDCFDCCRHIAIARALQVTWLLRHILQSIGQASCSTARYTTGDEQVRAASVVGAPVLGRRSPACSPERLAEQPTELLQPTSALPAFSSSGRTRWPTEGMADGLTWRDRRSSWWAASAL